MVKEFNKSLSNTSTTSVESGIFEDFESDENEIECLVPIGETVKEIIKEANKESRMICGWKSAINYLNETEYPEHSLFFFFVPNKNNDCILHIQEVMMKAFCLENDIYVIQLDSVEKLNSLIGSEKSEKHLCALVQRSTTLNCKNPDDGIDLDDFTQLEETLIDYCEEHWAEQIQPIIRLPDK